MEILNRMAEQVLLYMSGSYRIASLNTSERDFRDGFISSEVCEWVPREDKIS